MSLVSNYYSQFYPTLFSDIPSGFEIYIDEQGGLTLTNENDYSHWINNRDWKKNRTGDSWCIDVDLDVISLFDLSDYETYFNELNDLVTTTIALTKSLKQINPFPPLFYTPKLMRSYLINMEGDYWMLNGDTPQDYHQAILDFQNGAKSAYENTPDRQYEWEYRVDGGIDFYRYDEEKTLLYSMKPANGFRIVEGNKVLSQAKPLIEQFDHFRRMVTEYQYIGDHGVVFESTGGTSLVMVV